MVYKFGLRKLPIANLHLDEFFVNCAIFRGLLKEIHDKLHAVDDGESSPPPLQTTLLPHSFSWNTHEAMLMHHLVNVMSCPLKGIHPYRKVLWQEAIEKHSSKGGGRLEIE
jgi:hypothetical protein